MNKTIKKVFCSAAIVLMLPSCASKVTYAEFKESFSKVEKAPEIEKKKISGKYEGESYSFSYNEKTVGDLTVNETKVLAAITGYMTAAGVLIAAENSEATYYAGSTYKIEYKEKVFEMDKYGAVTYIKDGDKTKLDISYTYKK